MWFSLKKKQKEKTACCRHLTLQLFSFPPSAAICEAKTENLRRHLLLFCTDITVETAGLSEHWAYTPGNSAAMFHCRGKEEGLPLLWLTHTNSRGLEFKPPAHATSSVLESETLCIPTPESLNLCLCIHPLLCGWIWFFVHTNSWIHESEPFIHQL